MVINFQYTQPTLYYHHLGYHVTSSQYVAAKQLAAFGQDTYRTIGVPREMKDVRVETVRTESISILNTHIRLKSIGLFEREEA